MAQIIDGTSRSGKAIKILVIDATELPARSERAYDAAEMARAAGCTAWRIMAPNPVHGGTYVAERGSVSAPVMTTREASARSGESARDW